MLDAYAEETTLGTACNCNSPEIVVEYVDCVIMTNKRKQEV
jgi:hypothetical protein